MADDEALDFQQLLAGLPDAVAILGPDGSVVWANRQCALLLGTTLDRLVGSDGLGRVHPDHLAKAFDGMAWAVEFPDRTAVVPYSLRRDDGTYVHAEIKSAGVPLGDGEGLVLVLRDGTTRTTLSQALATVAAGGPLVETARALVLAVESRWPHTRAAAVHVEDGRRLLTTGDLPAPLVALLRGGTAQDGTAGPSLVPDDGPRPWDLVSSDRPTVVVDEQDLPPSVAAVATRHGYRACAVAAVEAPGSEPAHIVAWFDEPAAAHLEWHHWAEEMTRILRLALERQVHHRDLHHRARHDALTGLLNRVGLADRALDLARAARRASQALGVLYIDLDRFKPVNDRYGHPVGDQVLEAVGERLADSLHGRLVARVGGDEFVVVTRLPSADPAGLDELAAQVEALLVDPVEVHDGEATRRLRVGASTGRAVLSDWPTEHGAEPLSRAVSHAITEADVAMYAAKRARRGQPKPSSNPPWRGPSG